MAEQVSVDVKKRDNMKVLLRMMEEVDIERFDDDPDLRALVHEMMEGVWTIEICNTVQEHLTKKMLAVIEVWQGGDDDE